MDVRKILFLWLLTGISPLFSSAQWTTVFNGSPSKRVILQFSAPSSSTIWAVLGDAAYTDYVKEVTGSADGGTNWILRQVSIEGNYQVNAVCALDNLHLWVAMESDTGGGCVAYSSDAGASWVRQDSAVFSNSPVWVYFWNDTAGMAIGNPVDNRFEIFTTLSAGLDWEKVSPAEIPVSIEDEYALTNSFCVIGDTVLFAGNTYGKIFMSPDKGKTWSYLPFPLEDIKKVIYLDSATLIAGAPGLSSLQWDLFITGDWGQHWTSIDGDGPAYTGDIAGVPGADSVLVSAGLGLSFSNDRGRHWSNFTPPGQNVSPYNSTILFTDLTHGWAGGVNPADGVGGISKYDGPAMNVPDLENNTFINIYPNPAADFIRFQISTRQQTIFSYRICDLTGRSIREGIVKSDVSGGSEGISVQGITPGYYLLSLHSKALNFQKELIVR